MTEKQNDQQSTDVVGSELSGGLGAGYPTEEAAIAAAKLAVDGLTDFDGQNCENCAGWDGEDRRCECGNRRVYWATTKLADGTFIAYAEAY